MPRRSPPGRERRVTAAWEAELVRVIEVDPHEVGQESANWTNELLAEYLGQQNHLSNKDKAKLKMATQGPLCWSF